MINKNMWLQSNMFIIIGIHIFIHNTTFNRNCSSTFICLYYCIWHFM